MTTTQTAVVTAAAVLVAVAAAIRSTWSPCGLSMLSTITPFGERAKRHRYGATAAWFIAGAVVGGLALGGCAAGAALLIEVAGPAGEVLVAVALAATLVTLVSDTGLARIRIPAHYRQVNERWLDAYRPWVYGAGFGIQIGCGLATYVTTAAVYLTVVLAALTGNPLAALAVGGLFGAVRGGAVLLTARVTSPAALLGFHQRFTGWRSTADRLVVWVLAIAAFVLAVPCGVVTTAIVAGAVGTVTLVLRVLVSGTGRPVQSVSTEPVVAGVGTSPATGAAESREPATSSVGGGDGGGRESRQRR